MTMEPQQASPMSKMDGTKGHLISKVNCWAVNSSKKWTNEFVFISMPCVFVRFLEEIEDYNKAFRNYLTSSLSSTPCAILDLYICLG